MSQIKYPTGHPFAITDDEIEKIFRSGCEAYEAYRQRHTSGLAMLAQSQVLREHLLRNTFLTPQATGGSQSVRNQLLLIEDER